MGDVIVAGGSVNIAGDVKGDVIAVGGSIRISGNVEGDVRIAGGSVEINGKVGKNVTAFGGSVILGEASQVGGGLFVFAGGVELRGEVERNARVGAGSLMVTGQLKDKLRAWVGDEKEGQFVVYPGASIKGQVVYSSHQTVEVKEGAKIEGGIEQIIPEVKTPKVPDNWREILGIGWLVAKLISFLMLLVVGLVFLAIAPRCLREVREKMLDKPWSNMGWGLVWLILTPIASFIVMLTIIGLPLASMTLAIYFIMLYVVKVFASYLVGYQVLKWLGVKHAKDGWILVLGVFLFVLLISIPFVGWLLKCILIVWALGAAIEFKKRELKKYR